MRTVEFLQLLGVLVGALAGFAVALEKRMVRRLKERRALSQETTAIPDLNPLARWRLSRLISLGVVRLTGSGRLFLDQHGYRTVRKTRRKRVAIVLSGVALPVLLFRLAT